MPLKKLGIKPGFNKQATASGAEGEWIDGDYVRFRYGLPEKIGVGNNLPSLKRSFLEQRELSLYGQV